MGKVSTLNHELIKENLKTIFLMEKALIYIKMIRQILSLPIQEIGYMEKGKENEEKVVSA